MTRSVVQVVVTGYGPVEERSSADTDLVIGRQRSCGPGVAIATGGGRTVDAKVIGVGKEIDLALLEIDDVALAIADDATVADRPRDFDRLTDRIKPEKTLVAALGILGVAMTNQSAAIVGGVREASGVVVVGRTPDAAARSTSFGRSYRTATAQRRRAADRAERSVHLSRVRARLRRARRGATGT